MNTACADNRSALPEKSLLARFPIALFATVMGLSGLSMAWSKAALAGLAPALPADLLRWAATLIWLFLAAVYALKALRFPQAVAAESRHPVKLNFFAGITIGLLLLATSWSASAPEAARWMWCAGAAGHLAATLYTMSTWLYRSQFKIQQISAAWFIPVVGNIIVPLAGVRYAPPEISWFFFSIGLVFWLVLMTLVLYRLFFHDPMPAKLNPTLFILIAPPAVGALSWLALNGGVIDAAVHIFFSTALFITLLLAVQAKTFLRTPFFLSAWAYSFPLAAVTVATLEMQIRSGSAYLLWLGCAMLAAATLVIAVLVVKTLQALISGSAFAPD